MAVAIAAETKPITGFQGVLEPVVELPPGIKLYRSVDAFISGLLDELELTESFQEQGNSFLRFGAERRRYTGYLLKDVENGVVGISLGDNTNGFSAIFVVSHSGSIEIEVDQGFKIEDPSTGGIFSKTVGFVDAKTFRAESTLK